MHIVTEYNIYITVTYTLGYSPYLYTVKLYISLSLSLYLTLCSTTEIRDIVSLMYTHYNIILLKNFEFEVQIVTIHSLCVKNCVIFKFDFVFSTSLCHIRKYTWRQLSKGKRHEIIGWMSWRFMIVATVMWGKFAFRM